MHELPDLHVYACNCTCTLIVMFHIRLLKIYFCEFWIVIKDTVN